MSQAFSAFKLITPEDIKDFSLQEALTNIGLSQGMNRQQLLDCKWQISLLKQRINSLQRQRQNEIGRLQRQRQNEIGRLQRQRQNEIGRLQRQNEIGRLKRQNEIDRLKRQNEALLAQQQIAKLQEKNKKLKNIVDDFEDQHNRRESPIRRRESAIAQREQAIVPREQNLARREQAIRIQETPFYLKGQFLFGYFLGLFGIGISLALGWKKPEEPGYDGLRAGLIIGTIYSIVQIILIIWKGYKECKCCKGKQSIKNTGKLGPQIKQQTIQMEQQSSIGFRRGKGFKR